MYMLRTVRYRCESCGYAAQAKGKDYALHFVRSAFIFLGIVFLGFMVMIGPVTVSEMMVGESISQYAAQNSKGLSLIGSSVTNVNDTMGLKGTKKTAYQLFSSLNGLSYVNQGLYDTIQPPRQTLKTGGDCDELAMLYVGVMRNMGYDAEVDINTGHRHAIAVVPYGNRVIVADLASDYIGIHDSVNGFWNMIGD